MSYLGGFAYDHPKTSAAAGACLGATIITDGAAMGLGPECLSGAEMGIILFGELRDAIRDELFKK